uniref:Uncharacterized protein n=1 Tax=Timema shepardi TaxID=629360 RepID=A0A7R9G6P9_TIMSH|nr:unnamed protein product [Timema shepardi]
MKRLRQCQREVMELHELNSMLGSQVETLSNKVQSNNHSLLQEMECDDMSHTNESYKLKEEALSVYQQLQLIYDHLTHYQRINSSFSEMTSETVPLKEETLQTFKLHGERCRPGRARGVFSPDPDRHLLNSHRFLSLLVWTFVRRRPGRK